MDAAFVVGGVFEGAKRQNNATTLAKDSVSHKTVVKLKVKVTGDAKRSFRLAQSQIHTGSRSVLWPGTRSSCKMRDAFNQFIPMVQNDFNGVVFSNGEQTVTSHVSSNGYYGYQPVVSEKQQQLQQQPMETSETDIQFNNYIEFEQPQAPNNEKQAPRKRPYIHQSDCPEFKKRRENGKF